MSRWTHAICEACWIDRKGSWRHDEELDADVLASVPVPSRVVIPEEEKAEGEKGTSPVVRCCFCAMPTIMGIYVRHDPAELKVCQQGATHDG